jgi:hypothetical protein
MAFALRMVLAVLILMLATAISEGKPHIVPGAICGYINEKRMFFILK